MKAIFCLIVAGLTWSFPKCEKLKKFCSDLADRAYVVK